MRENENCRSAGSFFLFKNKLQLIIVNGIFQTCNRTFTSVKQKSIFLTFIILAQFIFNSVFGQNYNAIETFSDHVAGITVMTTDSEKKLLIAGDEKGNIYFYDLISGKQIQKVSVHAAAVTQLRFNSNGKLLISATADGEIKIFDFEKNKVVQAIYSPEYSGIGFVLFSIADGFIYFNGNNKLFKTRSDLSQTVNQIYVEHDTLFDAVITSDRSSLIYSAGNVIKVLNTRTDNLRQEIKFGTTNIRKIALVKDTILATWSADGTLAMWNYKLNQLEAQPIFFMKAGNPSPLTFSESGRLMCSGNIGNWARIWIPLERQIYQELFMHKETVTSSAFGVTDDFLYTGSLDKTIIKWQKGGDKPPVIPKPVTKTEIKTEPTPVPKVQNPDVQMANENVPTVIKGRKVISTEKIELNVPQISIYVYDNSYIDGDTMSLFFNGQWIVDHYGVTKKKYEVKLNLIENTNNYLVLFANNLGKSPPNTAEIEFDDGKKKYFYRLSSDLKTCSAINFFYKK